jgi:hypothetical protein
VAHPVALHLDNEAIPLAINTIDIVDTVPFNGSGGELFGRQVAQLLDGMGQREDVKEEVFEYLFAILLPENKFEPEIGCRVNEA